MSSESSLRSVLFVVGECPARVLHCCFLQELCIRTFGDAHGSAEIGGFQLPPEEKISHQVIGDTSLFYEYINRQILLSLQSCCACEVRRKVRFGCCSMGLTFCTGYGSHDRARSAACGFPS